jgi:hypothetical protein
VSTKPKRASRRESEKDSEEQATSPTTIVVRRGALKRFDSMKKKTAGLPVNLVWDRRVGGERRAETPAADGERRKTDRRKSPPFTWTLADFVVVVPPDGEVPPAADVEKKGKKK